MKRRPYRATVADAVSRDSGPFWDNLRASPDYPAFAATIGAILNRDRRAEQVAEWGEPCPEFHPECPACRAWQSFNGDAA